MEFASFIVLILAVFIIIIFSKIKYLSGEINRLTLKVKNIEDKILKNKKSISNIESDEVEENIAEENIAIEAKDNVELDLYGNNKNKITEKIDYKNTEELVEESQDEKSGWGKSKTITPELKSIKLPDSDFMLWLKENWTGFLGISILSLGITFAGIYVGLSAAPFVRFMMLQLVAIGFIATSLYLRKLQNWKLLSGWLQASGGALFLLGCLGANIFPSLNFVSEYNVNGYFLIAFGLLINLILSWFSTKQINASFHVILNLLVLSVVAKEGLLILYSATIITFFGLILSYRTKWEYNTIGCVLAFSIFNYYFSNSQDILQISYHGVFSSMFVGVYAILSHYRKIYSNKDFDKPAFAAHILSWTLLGANLYLYSVGSEFVAIILAFSALVSFILSYKAKRINIRWLFVTDLLVAETLAILSIISLYKLIDDIYLIPGLILLEVWAFSVVMFFEKEKILLKISLFILGLCSMIEVLTLVSVAESKGVNLQNYLIAFTFAVLFYLSRLFLTKYNKENDEVSEHYLILKDICFGMFSFVAIILSVIYNYNHYYLMSILLLLILINKNLYQYKVHKRVLIFLVVEMLLISWFQLNYKISWGWLQQLGYSIPGIVLLSSLFPNNFLYSKTKNKWLDNYWVYIFITHVFVVGYIICNLINDFLPAVIMLLISLLSLELSNNLQLLKKFLQDRKELVYLSLRKSGFIVFLIAIAFHMTVNIQSEATMLHFISIRFIFEVIYILMGIYWFLSCVRDNNKMLNLSFDVTLGLLILTNIVEVSVVWQSSAYIILSILLVSNFITRYTPKRGVTYSILFLLAGLIQISIVTSSWASPIQSWYLQSSFTGIVCIILAFLSGYIMFQKKEKLCEISFLNKHKNKILNKTEIVTFVPTLLALAVFLYWRFDKVFLTLAFVIEIFAVVCLAYIIRSNVLIRISFISLLACVIRLIFFDLSQSDLLVRSLIFIMVGMLMVGMHVIYKKFEYRLKK